MIISSTSISFLSISSLNILYYVLIFLFQVQLIQSCFPSFDDLPPPVVHTECLKPQKSCGRGYYCGPYGCARVRRTRLHGVRNYHGNTQMIKKLGDSRPSFGSVNDAMYDCCQDRELSDACLEICGFDKYNKQSILQIAFGQSKCPLIALPVIHACASRSRNHSKCCAQSGVSEDCMMFCQPNPRRRRVVQKQMHCLDEVELMKACFYTDLSHEIYKEIERDQNDIYFIDSQKL